MELDVTGEIIEWRGPAPHHFVALPADVAGQVALVARAATYGWGVIPVEVRLGGSRWRTSLFPKDGGYVLPLRAAERRAEGVALGDTVTATIRVLGL